MSTLFYTFFCFFFNIFNIIVKKVEKTEGEAHIPAPLRSILFWMDELEILFLINYVD